MAAVRDNKTRQRFELDVRLIVAALKINTDLERMGDLSVNIAQRAKSLMEEPVIKPMIDIPHIAGLVQSKGIRCEMDLWGYDVPHDWPSWRAQLAHHLPRFC